MSQFTRDERLAELIGELVEQERLGQSPDVEQVARQHPDLAADLRELWTTAMIAEDVASFSDLLKRCQGNPPAFVGLVAELWRTMNAVNSGWLKIAGFTSAMGSFSAE